jgi:uncharacterized surface protein with fasciclin (FAS1) repeats
MHFSSFLLPLVPFIVSVNSWDFVDKFQQELQNEGLTGLASALSTANQTSIGQGFLSDLALGNYTIFAPTNEASTLFPYHFIIVDY